MPSQISDRSLTGLVVPVTCSEAVKLELQLQTVVSLFLRLRRRLVGGLFVSENLPHKTVCYMFSILKLFFRDVRKYQPNISIFCNIRKNHCRFLSVYRQRMNIGHPYFLLINCRWTCAGLILHFFYLSIQECEQ